MIYVQSYRDLKTYKSAMELAKLVYVATLNFPREETYSLTDQIRRSSRSVGSQLAEAWGKRRYEKHFVSKLSDADSERFETQHWLEVAAECKYMSSDTFNKLNEKCLEVGALINGMIQKSHLFCLPERS